MDKMKIVSRIAIFSAVAAFVFAILSAVSTYFIIQITYSSGAPIDYIAFNVISTMLPYLTTGVISLIVAVMTKSTDEDEMPEKEEAPAAEAEKEVSA